MTKTKPLAGLGIVMAALALGAGSALASAPQQTTSSSSWTTVHPAGTYCDFTLQQQTALRATETIYRDKAGSITRTVEQVTATILDTNLNTGYALTDTPELTITNDGKTEQQVGVFFRLRNASGTVVLDSEGQLVVDEASGAVLKASPTVNPDFRAVLCTALGGHEA